MILKALSRVLNFLLRFLDHLEVQSESEAVSEQWNTIVCIYRGSEVQIQYEIWKYERKWIQKSHSKGGTHLPNSNPTNLNHKQSLTLSHGIANKIKRSFLFHNTVRNLHKVGFNILGT